MKGPVRYLTLFLITGLLIPLTSFGRQHTISRQEVEALVKSGHLVQAGVDTWRTKGGLLIKGKDPKGLTRLEHIMRHSIDMPNRPKHGVFSIEKTGIIDLMDRTYNEIKKGSLKASKRGGNAAYTFRTGNDIGYLGGKEGQRKGHPKLRSVRMVLKDGTPEVVTFFPM